MTPRIIALISLNFVLQVVGQIFFKMAMDESAARQPRERRVVAFVLGIAAMAFGFFIGLSQLSEVDLSKFYPFEGIERVAIVVAAAFFLREKITPRVIFGVALICAGLFLVAG